MAEKTFCYPFSLQTCNDPRCTCREELAEQRERDTLAADRLAIIERMAERADAREARIAKLEVRDELRSALNPPEGCVRLPDGREIKHQMWRTLDGGWVLEGFFAYHPTLQLTSGVGDDGTSEYEGVNRQGEIVYGNIPAAACYSTHESAESARAKGGEPA